MNLLNTVKYNNFLLQHNGIVFTTPFIRKAFGQYPYNPDVVTLSFNALGRSIQKIIKKQTKPFIVIVEDENQKPINVIYVPFQRKGKKIQLVLSKNKKISVGKCKTLIDENKLKERGGKPSSC